jgi:prolyl oligopeptidase
LSSSPRDCPGVAVPPTPERTETDTYHGTLVQDPYRWLEEISRPDVRAWIERQNAFTRRVLDAWPRRPALHARLTELVADAGPTYLTLRHANGLLFALKRQPPLEQNVLVAWADPDDPACERTVLDPNRLDPTGATTIDWFEPSPDGSKVAVSLSLSGSESGDAHVFDVATGRQLPNAIPRVNGGTAGGSLAWETSGDAFVYTRYPRPGERPDGELPFWVQVYRHVLGTDTSADTYEIGREFPKIAEIALEAGADGRHILASVQRGDGGEFAHWVRSQDGVWRALTRIEERCVAGRLDGRGGVYLVVRDGAGRGRIVRAALDGPSAGFAAAREVVPEREDAIQTSFAHGTGIWTGENRLYVLYQMGGPNAVEVFSADGAPLGTVPTPSLSMVDDLVVLDGGDVLVSNQSLTQPRVWLRIPRDGGDPVVTALSAPSPADFSDCEVVRDHAVSRDGTHVPMTILRRSDLALDGSNPTILYGYGGYGVCQTPLFRSWLKAWTEQGGVLAIAHVRGGGEFGHAWHHAGRLDRKQNVFDDFASCASRLLTAGYATREKLALMGGSNGGLLMGAMIVQHPSMARAVVSLVGLYDMLRVEATPNGAFNVPEFGSVEDPAMFRALYAYSPYHNVRDGIAYPAVLLTAGENDPRVEPWQSRKMAARLQKATTSGRPVLLRTNAASGHGLGTALSHVIDELADVLAFLERELGVDCQP